VEHTQIVNLRKNLWYRNRVVFQAKDRSKHHVHGGLSIADSQSL
jgi:hypothetical protein